MEREVYSGSLIYSDCCQWYVNPADTETKYSPLLLPKMSVKTVDDAQQAVQKACLTVT